MDGPLVVGIIERSMKIVKEIMVPDQTVAPLHVVNGGLVFIT